MAEAVYCRFVTEQVDINVPNILAATQNTNYNELTKTHAILQTDSTFSVIITKENLYFDLTGSNKSSSSTNYVVSTQKTL